MTTTFDATEFFDAVRGPLFSGHMTQSQVDGLNQLLRLWQAQYPEWDKRWVAYALATAHHETGRAMQPVEEVGQGEGRPYGEPDPVTGLVYYGRGLVQLTGKNNYAKQGAKLGLDLVDTPENAMAPLTSAVILFSGMRDGDFTGKKLADYFNPVVDDPISARRIVNGLDRAVDIASYHRLYLSALQAATASIPAVPTIQDPPTPSPPVKPPAPPPAAAPSAPDLSALIHILPTPEAYAAFYKQILGTTP